jgi:prepilin-type N-terminal cleavage/methylation domain-containing protein
MKNQKGVTAVELIFVVVIGAVVAGMGGLSYVVYHFAAKVW